MFEQVTRRRSSQPQRLAFGNMPVPGTKAGAVVSVGLVVVAWVAVPLARPFILGTVGLGAIVGTLLYWLHNRE
ncbi:MAG TPA: hypothetical protein VGP19_15600 [Candidatus Acidoferrales bacterium]|jgi:hypothetical protein|nr:hypothetical protein [Candidatus Acidoferrales bacterium]